MSITGKLVIIGSGIAGLSAARSARRRYPHVDITIVSEAPTGFYNRIALGAYVTGKRSTAELHTFAHHLFAAERIHTCFGVRVAHIDADHRQVTLVDGTALAYDKLILALGASPVLPPIPGVRENGVFTLWTLDHAKQLKAALTKAQRVTIIGGGVLGVEAALDITATGKTVHLVEAAGTLMPHLLEEKSARSVGRTLTQRGIHVVLNSQAEQIIQLGTALSTQLPGRSIESDLVLVSIGVRPNLQLAVDAGLRTANGIVVNNTYHTSNPNILACGNCIVQPKGETLLWNPAKEQGWAAGNNAFSTHSVAPSRPAPVHLKSESIPIFVLGNPKSVSTTAVCIRENDVERGVERVVYISTDGKLEYAMLRGDVNGFHELERWFKTEQSLPDHYRTASTVTSLLAKALESEPFTKTAWTCDVCGYTHEGNLPPHICPVCSVGKDQFLAA
ncbi:MAG: FAD-dependent oxidoreductase [Deltaproteobacteria bacterium]|nr:FAD-dependent oxidoreductase [Deltaproteobacteria bacterium]MBN2673794.1 FAD-dependent oxidoreductase [Deltaproteobacteria bacterium]